jgi:hypothetical protein
MDYKRYIVSISILLLIAQIVYLSFKQSKYKNDILILKEQISALNSRKIALKDTLRVKDSIKLRYVDKINQLNETLYVKIAAIDTMSISELQSYFADRYKDSVK